MKEKVLYWSPRILAILAILFTIMFSFDCFEAKWNLGEQFTCFLMHNIPAFIITGVLIIAWKWELAGGILFLVVAIAGSIFFRVFSGNPGGLIVLLPFVLTGILFILNHDLTGRKH